MSFWDWVLSPAKAIVESNAFGKLYHNLTGTPNAEQRRQQMYAAADQMRLYKQQTEITNAELARVQNETEAEKRRINEKQIRALRRNFRPVGFMDDTGTYGNQLSNTLGG